MCAKFQLSRLIFIFISCQLLSSAVISCQPELCFLYFLGRVEYGGGVQPLGPSNSTEYQPFWLYSLPIYMDKLQVRWT